MPDTENTPAAPAVVVPPPIEPKPRVQASALPDDALKARIDAAEATGRNKALKELGVTDMAQLKAALDALKAADEAKKTESEKFAELSSREQQARTKLAQYEQAIASVWETDSARLTAEQSKAVTDIAGDDLALRVRTLNALRPTWGNPQVPTAQPVSATPVSTLPATTAPLPNAPATTTVSPTDTKATHANLKTKNPVVAANYAAQHPEVFL